jgi:hypothetical protein
MKYRKTLCCARPQLLGHTASEACCVNKLLLRRASLLGRPQTRPRRPRADGRGIAMCFKSGGEVAWVRQTSGWAQGGPPQVDSEPAVARGPCTALRLRAGTAWRQLAAAHNKFVHHRLFNLRKGIQAPCRCDLLWEYHYRSGVVIYNTGSLTIWCPQEHLNPSVDVKVRLKGRFRLLHLCKSAGRGGCDAGACAGCNRVCLGTRAIFNRRRTGDRRSGQIATEKT